MKGPLSVGRQPAVLRRRRQLRMKQLVGLLLSFLLAGMLLACGAAATALPAATSATSPVSSPTPSLTALPSPTLAEVATPTLNRTVTPDASATALPAPSLAPTATPRPAETPDSGKKDGPVVKVGGAEFPVELAITSPEKSQGLSDRPSLAPDTGMLFIYEQQSRFRFWMRNMHFPLDMVWIGSDCTVADVTLNAPAPDPGQTLNQLPRYSPASPALYVLEINAGEAPAKGIEAGVEVAFTGDLAGRYGC